MKNWLKYLRKRITKKILSNEITSLNSKFRKYNFFCIKITWEYKANNNYIYEIIYDSRKNIKNIDKNDSEIESFLLKLLIILN